MARSLGFWGGKDFFVFVFTPWAIFQVSLYSDFGFFCVVILWVNLANKCVNLQQFSFKKKMFLNLCFISMCLGTMFVLILRPEEAGSSPMELQMIVSLRVSEGNENWVLWKRNSALNSEPVL